MSSNCQSITNISLDGTQVFGADKKGGALSVRQGRPRQGALSTYPQQIRELIVDIREKNPGWGALNIRLELEVK